MGTRLCVSLAFPHLRNYGSVDHVELIPPGQLFELLHLGEKTSEIQLIMAFLTRNRRKFRLNCQFSTFHVTIRLYK